MTRSRRDNSTSSRKSRREAPTEADDLKVLEELSEDEDLESIEELEELDELTDDDELESLEELEELEELLEDDGVEITLDGIAKGYVVDRMAAVLEAHGARGYLVNGGGDIRTGGTRDGVQPWRVGVCDPEQTDAELDVLPLTDGAVATSGSYEIYFDRERTRHHIVTAAGVSPGECLGVTVRAATAMLADALATAAFVAGPTAGIRLVESVPGCSCLVVDAHGAQHSSSSWLPGGSHRGAP